MKNDDTNNSFCSPVEVDNAASSCCGTSATTVTKTDCCDGQDASCCDKKETAGCCSPAQADTPKKEDMATIEVVGPGCASCQQLHKIVQYVSPSLGIENEVIYLSGQEGISRMMELGVMQAPILVVNGKIAMKGYSPSTEKIKEAILAAVK
jgi:hypothetical protein